MKRSKSITLGSLFLMAVCACNDNKDNEWVTGYGNDGKARDTVHGDQQYRYYHGGWYPVHNNLICPAYYGRGYSVSQICDPAFRAPGVPSSFGNPVEGISTGGFGESGEGSAGE